MKKIVNVVAAVIRNSDKYFVAQRPDKGFLGKKWEFPGGKIEVDETKEQALIREIKEELNVDIKVHELISVEKFEYEKAIIIMSAYEASILHGEINLNEHIDSKWVTIDQMKDLDFADIDILVIEKLKD